MKKKKATGKFCIKCKGKLDEMDLQYGCMRCKIIAEHTLRKPSEYSEKEKKFFKNLERLFKE